MSITAKSPATSYLDENLALFAGLLRREGLPVGTAELFDALNALALIDLSEREACRIAMRAAMVKDRRDQIIFDRCFDLFFVPPETRRLQLEEVGRRKQEYKQQLAQAGRELQFKGEALQLTTDELQQYGTLSHEQRDRLQDFISKTEHGKNVEPRFRPLLETVVKSHLRYCRTRPGQQPDASSGEQEQDFAGAGAGGAGAGDGMGAGSGAGDDYLRERDIEAIRAAELPAAEQLLQKLSRKLAVQILRRRRMGPRRGPLDLRRSMRDNMRYGGTIFNLKRRPKRRSRQQILLICDVSASMKNYSTFVLHFIYGLREVVRNLSCFSFADSVENLTPEIRGRSGLQQLLDRVIRRSNNWGGGTDLGSALREMLHKYPDLLNAGTTVIVVSDTKTIALDRALQELEKLRDRVKRVIWLNPLPLRLWSDYRSIHSVAELVEMWPCNTIAQLEEVMSGKL